MPTRLVSSWLTSPATGRTLPADMPTRLNTLVAGRSRLNTLVVSNLLTLSLTEPQLHVRSEYSNSQVFSTTTKHEALISISEREKVSSKNFEECWGGPNTEECFCDQYMENPVFL